MVGAVGRVGVEPTRGSRPRGF